MKVQSVVPWLLILSSMLAAGMYVGRLEQRLNDLEAAQRYYHGDPPLKGSQ